MDKYLNIPPPLRERGLFCCWRYEDKDGRKTQIPYDPASGQRAQTNNPRTFVDFKTGWRMSSGYDGIGFLINDGLFVIDCDHCRRDSRADVPITVSESTLDDDTVIAKATYARNGSTFKKLWSGDCSGYASRARPILRCAGF